MFAFTLTLVGCLSLVSSREVVKPKPGGLGNSILNFGKMEVNFFLNADKKNGDTLKDDYESPKSQFEWIHPSRSQTNLRPESTAECPCSGNMRYRDISPNPADLLSKILMSNDLFSFKDPISSNQCCTSHEQIQEEFYIEFSPKQNQPAMHRQVMPPQNPMFLNQQFQQKGLPYPPFLVESFFPIPNKQTQSKSKSKGIEIFFFPTTKTVEPPKSRPTPVRTVSPDIQIVGDKKTTMLIDLIPPKSSVKKDLTQDKMDIEINTEESVRSTMSESNFNTL